MGDTPRPKKVIERLALALDWAPISFTGSV
jgi:hypothetical protein